MHATFTEHYKTGTGHYKTGTEQYKIGKYGGRTADHPRCRCMPPNCPDGGLMGDTIMFCNLVVHDNSTP